MSAEFEFRLHVTGPDKSWGFAIPEGRSTIGRQVGNELMLDDPQVSRKHAQLDCTTTECLVTDLGSSNGTCLNEEKLSPKIPTALDATDTIKIGPFTLEVEKVPVERPRKAKQPATREQPAKATPKEVALGEEPFSGQPLEAKHPSKPVRRKGAPPPPSLPPAPETVSDDGNLVPPGLSIHSSKLLDYLPGIYHNDFMARFLGIFEAILAPLEWNIDNFDLFLDPGTAPAGFLPWLENWFNLPPEPGWSEEQRRTFLKEAHLLYARRGTRWALARLLEIYLECESEIIDDEKLEPFTFRVKIPLRRREVDPNLIEAIIDASKPAHTSYKLEFRR